jgi:hypothetical protein
LQGICGYLEVTLLTSKISSYYHNISIILLGFSAFVLYYKFHQIIGQQFVIIITYEPLNIQIPTKNVKKILSSNRGTKSVYSESDFRHWINENKQSRSIISKSDEGQKISAFKGTKIIRINQKPKTPQIPTKRVRIFNKGTQRKIIEN